MALHCIDSVYLIRRFTWCSRNTNTSCICVPECMCIYTHCKRNQISRRLLELSVAADFLNWLVYNSQGPMAIHYQLILRWISFETSLLSYERDFQKINVFIGSRDLWWFPQDFPSCFTSCIWLCFCAALLCHHSFFCFGSPSKQLIALHVLAGLIVQNQSCETAVRINPRILGIDIGSFKSRSM